MHGEAHGEPSASSQDKQKMGLFMGAYKAVPLLQNAFCLISEATVG